MARTVKIDGYDRVAQISTMSGDTILTVAHNNSTHYVIISAPWIDDEEPEEGVIEESFRYTCEPNSTELAYMRALLWAVQEAMQR